MYKYDNLKTSFKLPLHDPKIFFAQLNLKNGFRFFSIGEQKSGKVIYEVLE